MKTFVVIEPIDLLVNLKLLIMQSEAMKTVAPRQLKNPGQLVSDPGQGTEC